MWWQENTFFLSTTLVNFVGISLTQWIYYYNVCCVHRWKAANKQWLQIITLFSICDVRVCILGYLYMENMYYYKEVMSSALCIFCAISDSLCLHFLRHFSFETKCRHILQIIYIFIYCVEQFLPIIIITNAVIIWIAVQHIK